MIRVTLAFIAMATLSGAVRRSPLVDDTHSIESVLSWNKTCEKIANAVSEKSDVYYAGSVNYPADIHHWALTNTKFAACSFEPGTPEDVGKALSILGETRTPFAVKAGGHSTNPGFSSTDGVQIAMSRFSDIVYDPGMQTVTIGAGLVWDDVYRALEPHGVNVVGGRVTGVGVAGVTLGGGYSYLTNQYGLTIDTVQAYELVMPNGTVIDVTETSSPDLFFALKGGLNNFGIATTFTLKVFPQTKVWAGIILYPALLIDEITQATANFAANNTDPKAALITSYNYVGGVPQPTTILFYNAPERPDDIFDEFLAIAPSVDGVTTRSFADFVQSIPEPTPDRAIFNTVSLPGLPLCIIKAIVNDAEASSWAQKLLASSGSFVNYDVQPFLPNLFSHNTTPSAYPPDRTRGILPLELYFGWVSSEFDQVIYDAIRTSAQTIQAHATECGQDIADAALYSNYAIFDTPLVKLYGANVPRLQAIKKAVDPENVMGLTGGFKL